MIIQNVLTANIDPTGELFVEVQAINKQTDIVYTRRIFISDELNVKIIDNDNTTGLSVVEITLDGFYDDPQEP